MTLGELLGREAKLPAGLAACRSQALRPTAARSSPAILFAALPGVKTDGARFIEDALQRGAAAVLVAEGAAPRTVVRGDHRGQRSAPAPGADRLALLRRSAGDRRRRHRHQRQDVGRVVRAPALGGAGFAGGKPRHGRRRQPVAAPRSSSTPRPTRSSCTASSPRWPRTGVTHLALEASSHGLQQRRVDGVTLAAGAFTNISRDHLDYHASFEDYFAQKLRLFTELLPRGAGAVVDVDSEAGRARGGGRGGEGPQAHLGRSRRQDLAARLCRARRFRSDPRRSSMTASAFSVRLPLVGAFQASNALVAAGLAMATGAERRDRAADAGHVARRARTARSRRHGTRRRADLRRLCPHARCARQGARRACGPMSRTGCVVVFGCGGDRDKGKRPEMGRVAVAKADLAIVTDDNPRSENAAAIRREILAGAPGAIEIGDRAAAIAEAVAKLEPRRCSAGGRQGPRDGANHRHDRDPVFRP